MRFMAEWFKAKVAEHTILASKFQYLHLELIKPDRIEFAAGQYLMMRVPGVEGLKQYSIASAPSMEHAVELLIDVSPQGQGSRYLMNLQPGDEVEFMAPAGRFVVAPQSSAAGLEKELWFVATGSGISGVRPMIMDLLVDKKDKRMMWLHWGLRYPEDVFWFSDFAELAEEYDNFNFDPVLSQPSGGWRFCGGRVTECVAKHHKNFGQIGAYLCGNKDMIEDVKKMLQQKGMADTNIHLEEFY